MTSKLAELGIIDGDLIKVEKGVPHEEELFEVHATIVTLVDGTSPSDERTNDEEIFKKLYLNTFVIAPAVTTVLQFKEMVIEEYNK